MKTIIPLTLAAMCFANAVPCIAAAAPPRIAWYGTLVSGLAEAKRSGRPILLISGAPQCIGVSGIW